MVKDPKSASFLHGFAEQWLTLRKLDLASPDPKLFPTFTPALRQAMIRESLLFFEAIVREDRSVLGPARRRLHLRQRAAGEALRHRRGQGEGVRAGEAAARTAAAS